MSRLTGPEVPVLGIISKTSLLKVVLLSTSLLVSIAVRADEFNDLVGTWKLKSHTIELKTGETIAASHTNAFIIYSTPEYMCYVGADPNREPITPESSPSDFERAFNSASSYCSRVELDTANRLVRHHVLVAKNIEAEGIVRERHYQFFSKDRLILKVSQDELAPSVANRTLVWERIR